MDEFDEFSEHRDARLPGQRLGEWVRKNRLVILYGLLLIAVMFSRGSWGEDEWWMANATDTGPVGSSLLYARLIRLPRMLFGYLGSDSTLESQAWPLRIPSVLGSILFLHYFRRWASRFLQSDVAGIAALILCATPLWFWQSQAIQVDLLFSAALGWSWLCWLAGYLLLRRHAEGSENEHQSWFGWSNLWLGFAFLLKGPMPLLLSFLLLSLFLVRQKDLKAWMASVMNWGSAVLLLLVALGYGIGLVATPHFRAWPPRLPQVQPIWIYAEYLVRDFFPWVLLLPALVVFLWGSGAIKAPIVRFLAIAFLLPFSICIWGDGARGTDPLMAYPFLALMLAGLLQPVYVEGVSAARIRRIGGLLATALWMAFLAFFAVGMLRLGGLEIQGVVTPVLGAMRLATLVLALGALSVTVRCVSGEGEFLVRETSATVCVVFFIVGTWGFHSLDSKLRNQPPMRGKSESRSQNEIHDNQKVNHVS